ncbi:MAG: aspartate carbamoyltransferase catalytic subunit [Syntrophales bacterium]|jgi:aspartate carbamoyltransferase catalytic subunit|nr:aspartate carbamoyltransferase catalytic subunit [Syntrophales bacterium]MCK9527136.1 aspartate carbamoyltransferase catalytic subunit [Syntrophales bacterium]MDX9921739.1 aspartate carbamoyltransferase catalytic subunit [Syntrophales bacterium]
MKLARKDVLGLRDFSADEINLVLETAESFREISTRTIKKVPTLRGITVINLFYEASTRTRTSFEIAAKRLSADAVNISSSTSSVVKGESFVDTAKTLEAMSPDIIVIRHACAGAPHILARLLSQSIINAGDGSHEHPTQALLDMLTIRQKKGGIEGLKVVIVGDIACSRVARSNIYGLTTMGARVTLCGPAMLIPRAVENMGVTVETDMKKALRDADVVMMLRMQVERQHAVTFFPSAREYARLFCLTRSMLDHASEDVIVMHPGPMNRGIEISPEVADGPWSVILDQVTNGVAVRMALLYLLAGGSQ